MTEPDIDVSNVPGVAELTAGPGHRLRRAREHQGLGVAEIADRLHLPERLVVAIENDDFAALPGAVFAQGYLRNYARQVGEPADDIVKMYNEARPREDYKPALHQFQLPMRPSQVTSSHGLVRTVTWLIVIALLILLVVWWRGYIKLPVPILGEEDETAGRAESVPLTALPGASAAKDENGLLTIPTPIAPQPGLKEPPEIVADATTPVDTALNPESVERQEPAGDEGVIRGLDGTVAAAGAADGADVLSADAGPPAPDEIRLVFEAPCWVDIRDSTGEKVLYGGIGAGETFSLSGTPPYQVLLGNSSAVKITLGGEEYSTAQHSNGRVARFVLDPSKVMNAAVSQEQ